MAEKCSRCSTVISRRTARNHLVLDGRLVCRYCIIGLLQERLSRLADSLLPGIETTLRSSKNFRFVRFPADRLFHVLNDAKVWLPLRDQIEYVDRIHELAPQNSEDSALFIEEYRERAHRLVKELKNGDLP